MEVLNLLGEEILPSVFTTLNAAGIGETIKILREAETDDGGGDTKAVWNYLQSEGEDIALDCPPIETVKGNQKKFMGAEQVQSEDHYRITLPTVYDEVELDIRPKDRLEAQIRGVRAARTYTIEHLEENSGAKTVAVCTLKR